jgi:hypothetical protein
VRKNDDVRRGPVVYANRRAHNYVAAFIVARFWDDGCDLYLSANASPEALARAEVADAIEREFGRQNVHVHLLADEEVVVDAVGDLIA